jgi:hypothetical protein
VILALSNVALYLLLGLGGLAVLFMIGLALGLGMWVGNGWLQARSDRRLQAEWQRWYTEQSKEEKKP